MYRRTLLKASTAALAGTLAAPASAQGSAKVLRCAPEANLASIDPIWTTATVAINHGYMVYDTLYGVDLSLTPRPQMVAGHNVSDDNKTWTFTLRDGLLFHNGEKVRSADCIASIDRWSKRAAWGQALGAVTDEMTVLDDKRFVIHLKKPFSSILYALGVSGCFIMPERIAKTDPFKQITDSTGSGPFKFVKDDWVAGARAAWVKNDKYVPRDEPADFYAGASVCMSIASSTP
jgi:peptide/nickel transport system substrate-binding protein